jgi:hypothetical protein
MVGAAIGGAAVLGFAGSKSASNKAASAARRAGRAQAEAGREAIETEQESAIRAQGFFEPFAGVAERGVEGSDFLANPQAQFDFLQSNPLFNLALENANRGTERRAAAGGRLSFGDTLQELSNNVLLASTPLIDRQRQDITNLLQFGGDIATSQANIETGQAARIGNIQTDIGAVNAAAGVGAANAEIAGIQGLTQALQTGVIGASGGFGGGTFQDLLKRPNLATTGAPITLSI